MEKNIFARYIDHTLLKQTATRTEINQLCEEALQNRFAAICVPPCYVEFAKTKVEDSGIKVATVIGFPFGYSHTEAKATEIELAIGNGAEELDVVMNISDLLNGNEEYILNELNYLTQLCHERDTIIKVIIESGVLTPEQIITACNCCAEVGVDFVKTSTGYADKGATIEAVQLMRKHLPKSIGIKASGGIKTTEQALAFIQAGANRIGTSNGVALIQGL
jgi:deoxyribose-phosphate aldolase